MAVELARYIQNDAFFDNVWEAYHALAWISIAAELLEEGRLQLCLEHAPLMPWNVSAEGAEDKHVSSGLPIYTAG